MQLAETFGMEFFETSASTSTNISEVGCRVIIHRNVLQHHVLLVCVFISSSFLQSFTRVTELVLQAHKRDVDNLLGALDDYLEKAALEEEKGSRYAVDDNTHRACAC